MTKIILFSGKAEAGKTTAAGTLWYLLVKHGEETGRRINAVIIPYADYVKTTAQMLFNWNGKKDEEGRALLQWWGTDIVRQKDPNFWVDTVVRLVKVAEDELDYVLIDDCRFPNELEAWDDYTHWAVRVERPGHENKLTPEQRIHPSETSLDDYKFDLTISATSEDELMGVVKEILFPIVLWEGRLPDCLKI